MEAVPDGLIYDFHFSTEHTSGTSGPTACLRTRSPSPFEFYKIMVPTKDSVLYMHILASTMGSASPSSSLASRARPRRVRPEVPRDLAGQQLDAHDQLLRAAPPRWTCRSTSRPTSTSARARSTARRWVGKKLVVFIDDMNMPKVDTYGTQQPIALLLTLMSRGFIYDRVKDLNQKKLKDLHYIGAMGPPGGGRNPVDTRFTALFNVYNLTPPTDEVLSGIYDAILEHALHQVRWQDQGVDQVHGRYAQALRVHPREAAADAVQVPLHLQPARPQPRVRGHVPRHRGRVLHGRVVRAAVPQRVLPHLLRSPHHHGGPDPRQRAEVTELSSTQTSRSDAWTWRLDPITLR